MSHHCQSVLALPSGIWGLVGLREAHWRTHKRHCQGPELEGLCTGFCQGAGWMSEDVCYSRGLCLQFAVWICAAATAGRPAPAAGACAVAQPCAAPPAPAT